MGKNRPRYVQTLFSNKLHERSVDHPLTRTLCGADVSNFTRQTPEDGHQMCVNCVRLLSIKSITPERV
jgi:hypothetical protein